MFVTSKLASARRTAASFVSPSPDISAPTPKPATIHPRIRLDITRQREVEEELNHSHRMEAVGRLAGGVAHDFNNITQSISLSCELALQHQLTPPFESKLLDVLQQTARAADITHQLLAFSRRQVLQPRVVNLNDCIRNALPMLTRAVGVGVSIELQAR